MTDMLSRGLNPPDLLAPLRGGEPVLVLRLSGNNTSNIVVPHFLNIWHVGRNLLIKALELWARTKPLQMAFMRVPFNS